MLENKIEQLLNDPNVAGTYYTYNFDYGNVEPNGGTSTAQIDIQADAEFIWLQSTYTAYTSERGNLTENTRLLPRADVAINDTGSGRNFFNSPTPVTSIAGNAQLPYILPLPRKLAKRSALTSMLTNKSSQELFDMIITLHGFRIYYLGNENDR